MAEKSPIVMRFPRDVKAWLQEQAELHSSSQNSEAIRAIRERMDRLAREANASGGEAA